MSMKRVGVALTALALSTPALAGCGGSSSAGTGADAGGGRLRIVTSFYPLQFVAEQVAGDRAEVASLTKPGAEPHDLELTPQQVGEVGKADLVVYLSGFQPSVDDAVGTSGTKAALDVAGPADLSLTYTPIEEGAAATDEAGSRDPHFWLDPTRLAAVADAVAQRLGQVDQADAATFTANAAELRSDLEALDGDLRTGLATCTNKNLVTSHNAFGYLAQRYGLKQLGITGLTPEQEPDPKALTDVATFVKANQVRTIYYETLVSPRIAEVVASETGAATAVLDPLEGLNDKSAGTDYLEVMRANLATLKAGQPCP